MTRSGQTAKIPWDDAAVLVLIDKPQAREIAAEGTLRQMVNRIAARPPAEWHRFAISLPDRGAAPFAFAAEAFNDLVLALADRDRPTEPSDGGSTGT